MRKIIIRVNGRPFVLRDMSSSWIKKRAAEVRAVLDGYGARKDSGRAWSNSYAAELEGAERCSRAFAAELRRRAARPRLGADGDGAGRGLGA